jgi:hypothetical protein
MNRQWVYWMQVDNSDLETLAHAPMDLNDCKYIAGNLKVVEVSSSSV